MDYTNVDQAYRHLKYLHSKSHRDRLAREYRQSALKADKDALPGELPEGFDSVRENIRKHAKVFYGDIFKADFKDTDDELFDTLYQEALFDALSAMANRPPGTIQSWDQARQIMDDPSFDYRLLQAQLPNMLYRKHLGHKTQMAWNQFYAAHDDRYEAQQRLLEKAEAEMSPGFKDSYSGKLSPQEIQSIIASMEQHKEEIAGAAGSMKKLKTKSLEEMAEAA